MQQHSWPAALCRFSFTLIGLAAAISVNPVEAQYTCSRCLNGHRFLPSSLMGDPFNTTHFTNATGGGLALDLTVPVRDLDGVVTDTIGGDVGFFLLDFEYQKSIIPRLALRGKLSMVGRVGTNGESVVASGASVQFGGAIGATIPIWSNATFAVSAVTDFRSRDQYVLDPYAFAQAIRDGGLDADSKATLLTTENANHWSAGARGAWAPKDWLGLNAILEAGRIDSPTAGEKSLTEMGIQVGFDFENLWDFPVGTSLAWREQAGPGRRGEFSGSYRSYELGLFYTGSEHFTIGGDFFWQRLLVDRAVFAELDAVQFRLVTRLEF